MIEKF